MGETDCKTPSPQKKLLAIFFYRGGICSIELKVGSHFGGQNKYTQFFTKHLQKGSGDYVCLHTATQI